MDRQTRKKGQTDRQTGIQTENDRKKDSQKEKTITADRIET